MWLSPRSWQPRRPASLGHGPAGEEPEGPTPHPGPERPGTRRREALAASRWPQRDPRVDAAAAKVKVFCASKDAVSPMKKRHVEWEKVFADSWG